MSFRAFLAAALVLVFATTPALADPAIGKRVDAVFADDTVTLTEAGKTVLVYRAKPADPAAEPGRSNYIGALYAPDGAALVEDRPGDHPHQRGVWWAWMKVQTGGKTVADGWYMKGLSYFVREKRFLGDAEGGGTLTVDVDWMVNSGPELAYVARETTKVTVRPLTAARDGWSSTPRSPRGSTASALVAARTIAGLAAFQSASSIPSTWPSPRAARRSRPTARRSTPDRTWASPGVAAAIRPPGRWVWPARPTVRR
jgi:hypothetical protein